MDKAKEWKKANPERVKAARKRYYEAHKERTKREAIEWARGNPDRVLLNAKAQAANRIYGHTGRLTVKDIEAVIERCGRVCHWCGKQNLVNRAFTLEHLEPRNDVSVLTIACNACNTGHAGENGGRIQTPDERKAKEKAGRHRRYVANPEYNKEMTKRWIAANEERHRTWKREYMRAYRAKKRGQKLYGASDPDR